MLALLAPATRTSNGDVSVRHPGVHFWARDVAPCKHLVRADLRTASEYTRQCALVDRLREGCSTNPSAQLVVAERRLDQLANDLMLTPKSGLRLRPLADAVKNGPGSWLDWDRKYNGPRTAWQRRMSQPKDYGEPEEVDA